MEGLSFRKSLGHGIRVWALAFGVYATWSRDQVLEFWAQASVMYKSGLAWPHQAWTGLVWPGG